jgi:hypothetical protein
MLSSNVNECKALPRGPRHFVVVPDQCMAVQVDSVRTRVESAYEWFQRLKIQYDEPLANFASNFNLRFSA